MKKRTLFILTVILIAVATCNIALISQNAMEPIASLFFNTDAITNGEADEPNCAAGGCNAASCSFKGGLGAFGFSGEYENSVSCVDTWACCFTTAYCFSKSKC